MHLRFQHNVQYNDWGRVQALGVAEKETDNQRFKGEEDKYLDLGPIYSVILFIPVPEIR